MTETQQLLAEYAGTGSDTAFRELVTRYVDFVYSAAVRLVDGDCHLAQDIAQIVFADLARLAPSLSREVMLGAWLHRHTCFVAAKTLRAERRRRARERQAVAMNITTDYSEANLAQVAPVLDDAINQLGTTDRKAILLRFFEQRDFHSVGLALGGNEESARKRVSRALDKLQSLLKRRGFTISAAALGSALAAEAVTAAPAGLAGTIYSAAMATAATGSGLTLTTLKLMTMSKLKLGLIGAVVVAGIATPLVTQYESQARLRDENQVLRQQNLQLADLKSENQRLSNLVSQTDQTRSLSAAQMSELMRLRSQVATVSKQNANPARTSAAPRKAAPPTADNNLQLDAPTVPLVPAANWTNAGNTEAASALWTFHWAVSRHDGSAFAQVVALDPDLETQAEQIFAAAPEEARRKFGSIDGVLYSMIAGSQQGQTPMAGLAIVSQDVHGDDGTVVEQHQYEDGRVRQNEFTVHRFDDGWRIVLRNEKILRGIEATLNSSGGQ